MRWALTAVAVVLAVLLPGRPAQAHTRLLSAVPAQDATLATAPAVVTLKFSARLNPGFTTIVVSDEARQRVPASEPAVAGAQSTVSLTRPPGNGRYTVAYRVVAEDGHTVQGTYAFTVADPAQVSVAAAESTDGNGRLIGFGVAGVLLIGVIAVILLRRRRSSG